MQGFNGVVRPLGDARPAWKVLRVLGNMLGLAGFDYDTSEQVRDQVCTPEAVAARLDNRVNGIAPSLEAPSAGGLQRISDVPIYFSDPLVRRAPSLQKTRDNPLPHVRMNPREAQKQGVGAATRVRVVAGEAAVTLDLVPDSRIAEGCVWVTGGHSETAALGAGGAVSVEVSA